MQNQIQRVSKNIFNVEEAIYYQNNNIVEIRRLIITKNDIPISIVNTWLSTVGINSPGTLENYAYKLKRYLEYIDEFNLEYYQVKSANIIQNFFRKIMHENRKKGVYTIKIEVGYDNLNTYQIVVTGFYFWLDEMFTVNKKLEHFAKSKELRAYVKKAGSKEIFKKMEGRENSIGFDYYEIWSKNHLKILGVARKNCSTNKFDHIKWYTKDEIKIIKGNFKTKRDLAMYSLGLEGARIEEIATIKINDFNSNEIKVFISESKTMVRDIFLSLETCQIIEDYIYTERAKLEERLNYKIDSKYLFLNLRKGKSQGKKIKQGNYRKILKNVGKISGMDPSKIITHAGRSTKVQKMLKEGATNEEIRIVLGWSSDKTIESYRKKFDAEIALNALKKINGRER
ncbi:tyrosine-type recombinase/integrase [Clostridium sp.]|jgi:integrase/recombinase XerD|uniref:tyrosine-type recombinase/integrase n=1 Tax=Clostridium sp. TaxID=1506 RepID=UPI003EEC3DFC